MSTSTTLGRRSFARRDIRLPSFRAGTAPAGPPARKPRPAAGDSSQFWQSGVLHAQIGERGIEAGARRQAQQRTQAQPAQGAIQLSLFDTRNLVEVTHPAYPGERLLVCQNPLVAQERARKRAALLAQTEQALAVG
ncbi:MAG: hypothetical protein FJ029_11890, partial [Actinobacteria bacterium]|nr:hypothetical protein [Actinomycetota bacterium]